jgi:drug/metabolite transporter (DMT)-like permease
MSMSRERLALASFWTVAILAGGNAVGIRFSNRELDPLWGAGLRFGLAALLLLAIVAVRRLPLPRGRALVGVILYGLLSFGASFAFLYYALVRVHAGLGQTLLALVPLATLLLAVIQGQEKLKRAAVIGSLLSVVGIAVVSGPSVQESVPVLSLLAILGSVLCLAQGTVLVRRFPPVDPVTTNAIAMAAGAALLFVGALAVGESFDLPQQTATWIALSYLVVVGSGVVFVLFLVVLHIWSASRAAYVLVLVPFSTVLVSVWLDDERVGAGLIVGGLLVLAGVYIGALRPATATG